MSTVPRLLLDGTSLSLADLAAVARHPRAEVRLDEGARKRMRRSRDWVDAVQRDGAPVVYGINTGFGSLASVPIDRQRLADLQRNLIQSHSAGTGDPLPIDVVRAAMLLRANTLAGGFSGIRPRVVETLLAMLDAGVTPWIPAQGSLGASGDLAPLSHLALVLSRAPEDDPADPGGRAYRYDPDRDAWDLMDGRLAMEGAGIERVVLEAKEGLALNNGTQISTALLALVLYDAGRLVRQADIAMAMSLEAMEGLRYPFLPELHERRPHPGQVATAENIRRLTEGSALLDRHLDRVQDAYSLRCHPQVMAGVRDMLGYLDGLIAIEMNATTDNPLIFPDNPVPLRALSGGNFHAQPVAFGADFLAIVLCEVGNIAERRIFRLSDKRLNGGLPSFLISNPGLESGLMIAQYTAAALVSENKALAHPASIDSIPSCENQEDHVSMAPIAARKARAILENVRKVVAIELFYAAQALDLRLQTERQRDSGVVPAALFGRGTLAAYDAVREVVAFLDRDRPLYPDIERLVERLAGDGLLEPVETAVGPLA